MPGAIISFTELRVEIWTHLSESGSTSSSSVRTSPAEAFLIASVHQRDVALAQMRQRFVESQSHIYAITDEDGKPVAGEHEDEVRRSKGEEKAMCLRRYL